MINFRTVMGSYQTFVMKGTVHSDRFGNLEPFISCDDGMFTRYLEPEGPNAAAGLFLPPTASL